MRTLRRLTGGVLFQRNFRILLWGLAGIVAVDQIVGGLSQQHMDTPLIWAGLEHFAHGISPYGVLSHRVHIVSAEGVVTRLPFGYVDPPGSALVGAPLGLLSVSAAGRVIVVASGVGLIVAFLALTSAGRGLATWGVALAAVCVTISKPFHHELSLGNLDLLALLPIALGLAAVERGHERLGAILMALGVCVKPTAAPVLLAPLLARRWRVTALAVSAALAVTLVGFAVVPHSSRFFTSVIPYLSGSEQANTGYDGSLAGLVRYLEFGSAIPSTATEVCGLLVFLAIALHYRRELSQSLQAAVALCVIATLLVPSYSFEVYGVYLVLALPFILRARGPLELTLVAIAVWLLVIPDVLSLSGGVVFHFEYLRTGFGRVAVAALVVVMLERQRTLLGTQDRSVEPRVQQAAAPSR